MKTLYLDFDGTVVDVWKRYFQVLNDFLCQNYYGGIRFDEYKRLKRQRLFDHEIVEKLSGQVIDITEYVNFKNNNLEGREYLKMDSLIGEPLQYIGIFHQAGFRIEILSQRGKKDNFMEEIKWLGIDSIFDAYTSVHPSKGENAKYEYLRDKFKKDDVMVGDGPVEKECAERCHIPFLFVNTGLYTKESMGIMEAYESVVEISNLFSIKKEKRM